MASRPVATMALAVAGAKGVMTWLAFGLHSDHQRAQMDPVPRIAPSIARHPSHTRSRGASPRLR